MSDVLKSFLTYLPILIRYGQMWLDLPTYPTIWRQIYKILLTPARTLSISGLKSRVLKLSFLNLKMMVKSGLEFILKLTEPLQSCCCPVQKYLPRMAELAWQLSRYLWRGSVNFKINSRPLSTIICKLKNDNFKTRDFSPLIERVLAGVEHDVPVLVSSFCMLPYKRILLLDLTKKPFK